MPPGKSQPRLPGVRMPFESRPLTEVLWLTFLSRKVSGAEGTRSSLGDSRLLVQTPVILTSGLPPGKPNPRLLGVRMPFESRLQRTFPGLVFFRLLRLTTGAEGGTRTPTGFRPLEPESSASAIPPLRLFWDPRPPTPAEAAIKAGLNYRKGSFMTRSIKTLK